MTLRSASFLILNRKDSSDCGGLRSLRSLRPLPTYPAWSVDHMSPSGPSPCPCPGVDMPPQSLLSPSWNMGIQKGPVPKSGIERVGHGLRRAGSEGGFEWKVRREGSEGKRARTIYMVSVRGYCAFPSEFKVGKARRTPYHHTQQCPTALSLLHCIWICTLGHFIMI